jgi:CheY-like chemotaxis protein/DNA-binding XRE family transcriptional regulator
MVMILRIFFMDALDLFLAQKLRFYRKQMKWPLKKIADALGLSLQHIQRYEQGVTKISASLLYRVAHLLKMDVNDFFEGFEDNDPLKDHDNLRILLIEDNPNDVFFFQKALDDYAKKIQIYIINDGEKASLFFSSPPQVFKPDLIFMDIHLPHVRGLDLLQTLKRHPFWKNIPVVILTTSVSDEDLKRAYDLQSSGFLRKSFSFDVFKQNLIHTLNYWDNAVKLPEKRA